MVLTRRAHRRRMDISRWLPNEVIVQIIQHSAQADQAILARASKLFHDLCLPILYRVVKIADFPDTIASFHSAIIENPSRADVVRSFTLVRPHDNLNHFSIQSRRDLLIATLKLMLNLDHLSVSRMALNEYYRRILLAECNFPRLSSCDIWVPRYSSTTPPADLVAGFLARHPNLKRVHLHSHPAMDVDVEPSVRISLPNLEYYAGDAAFFFPINAIGLKEAQLTWFSAVDVSKITAAVSSVTKPDLPFVSSHRYLDDPYQIVTSVSRHMRHTKTLRLQSLKSPFMRLSEDVVRQITECLPRFTGLVYLEMGYRAIHRPDGHNDEDRIVAEQWGEACPTLEACSLNLHAWKKVYGRWELFPMKEFWVLAELPDPIIWL